MNDDLRLGLQQHQRGRLDEAATLYRQVLAARPDHPDALHLLGVVAHQKGDQACAAELIGRAVALRPGAADYHANLGEAYRAGPVRPRRRLLPDGPAPPQATTMCSGPSASVKAGRKTGTGMQDRRGGWQCW